MYSISKMLMIVKYAFAEEVKVYFEIHGQIVLWKTHKKFSRALLT